MSQISAQLVEGPLRRLPEPLAEALRAQTATHSATDPAHDLQHVLRVVANTRQLLNAEQGDARIAEPAAWLHDCITLPKNSPDRAKASALAAQAARPVLTELGIPSALHDAIGHAIEAHSYSANIPPRTLEAAIVQDADRLDALGAIGIARCFTVGGTFHSSLYHPDDPFCTRREPADREFCIDHFYAKLLKLADTMQTPAGREVARQRTAVLERFLDDFRSELGDFA
ncbi:MAG: HD domain-containing protein [Pseudomonadota bacterium]